MKGLSCTNNLLLANSLLWYIKEVCKKHFDSDMYYKQGRINTVRGPWALPLEGPFINENYSLHSLNLDNHKARVISL